MTAHLWPLHDLKDKEWTKYLSVYKLGRIRNFTFKLQISGKITYLCGTFISILTQKNENVSCDSNK